MEPGLKPTWQRSIDLTIDPNTDSSYALLVWTNDNIADPLTDQTDAAVVWWSRVVVTLEI